MAAVDEPLEHIFRTAPPWREAEPLTECGRSPNDVKAVITVDQAVAKWKREGKMRAAMTTCMTCINRVNYRPAGWLDDPVSIVARDSYGPQADLMKTELHALAALAAAHPDEFTALVSSGNDLAARRATKRQPGRR